MIGFVSLNHISLSALKRRRVVCPSPGNGYQVLGSTNPKERCEGGDEGEVGDVVDGVGR